MMSDSDSINESNTAHSTQIINQTSQNASSSPPPTKRAKSLNDTNVYNTMIDTSSGLDNIDSNKSTTTESTYKNHSRFLPQAYTNTITSNTSTLIDPVVQIAAGIGEELVKLPPPVKDRCMMCQLPSKYTCPRCSLKTCSLICVNNHKTTYNCSGKPLESVFVDKKSLDVNVIKNDLKLLTKVEVGLNDGPNTRKSNKFVDDNDGPQDGSNGLGLKKQFGKIGKDTNHHDDPNNPSNPNNPNTINNNPNSTQLHSTKLDPTRIDEYINFCQRRFLMHIFASFTNHSTYKANNSNVVNVSNFGQIMKKIFNF